MNPKSIAEVLQLLHDLVKEDREAALCLLDWGKVALMRAFERYEAKQKRRKPLLRPIELRQPSLADMGINVVGCSACAITPKHKICPGCGNHGVAPMRKVTRVKSRRKTKTI